MFEDVKTHEGTVNRLHPEAISQVHKFVHHPTKLQAIHHLECSCGYSGFVAVPKEGTANCPGCGSPTVHPDNVTEKPTTHVHFRNGEKHVLVATPEQVKAAPATKLPDTISMTDVHKAIDEKFNTIIGLLQQKEQKKKSSKKSAQPSEASKEGAN